MRKVDLSSLQHHPDDEDISKRGDAGHSATTIIDGSHKRRTVLQAIVISRDPQQQNYLRQAARSQALLRLQREATEAGIRADASIIDAKERELMEIILPWMESAYAFLQEHSAKVFGHCRT